MVLKTRSTKRKTIDGIHSHAASLLLLSFLTTVVISALVHNLLLSPAALSPKLFVVDLLSHLTSTPDILFVHEYSRRW